MIPCIIESPFKGQNKAEESRNRAYLNKCIRWCIQQGYTPYASHKQLTDSLDDDNELERDMGILAGLDMSFALLTISPEVVVFFFEDYGMSGGMMKAKRKYISHNYIYRLKSVEIGKL